MKTQTPECPHCGHVYTTDDILQNDLVDIYGIAAHDCAPTRIREGNTNKLIWEDA